MDEFDEDTQPSKTQIKKDMLALQSFGESLLELSPHRRAQLPLSEKLAETLEQAEKIHHHSAKKRQLQYIGKLMRNEDIDAIQNALEQQEYQSQKVARIQPVVEQWVSRLLDDAANLKHFISEYPNSDSQQLRQLVRAITNKQNEDKNTQKLHKLIRSEMLRH